jgi:tetratricopeptide (TPR) repeat protein
MTPKRLTYAELLQQRRENLFIGREKEREAFRRNLSCKAPEHLIFALHGQAGMGKSFLVARYQVTARENGALTALTDEAEATAVREQSVLRAMARLARQLAEAGAPLKAFDERYQKYRQCRQEIEADPAAPQGVFDSLGRKTVRVVIGGARMTPGGQAAGGPLKDVGGYEQALVEQVEGWTAYLTERFKDKDEVALVKEPVETLTPLFVAGVNELADERPVVLCFDTWERTGAHLDEWLRGLPERGGLSAGVWLVIAGRNPPGDEWQPCQPLMAIFELKEFTEEETRDYLKQRGITEEARLADILAFSEGVPVWVSTLASARGGSATEAASGPVDRYLKWVDDERQRETALDCAAARRLDKDVVAALMGGDDAGKLFDWLRALPFVQSRPGYWEYHPKVRQLMLRFARKRSAQDSQAVHGKLRAYYQGLSAEKGEKARCRDEVWRRHMLEALYHGLMQESDEAEREGLEAFLLALRGYYPLAGEIATTWRQAAKEQEAAGEVTPWAEVLGAGWAAIENRSWESVLSFCEAVRERKDLSGAARSEVHFIGGLASYNLQDYARAAEDFGRAIELNPELAPPYYELPDYARAIKLGPEYATAYYERGNAYAELQDYARAIEEYGQAIALNPRYAPAYNNRGNAYYNLQDYRRAIEDYGRAIELDPENARAYNNRGNAYYDLQAYARAVEEYGRAIELNPEYAAAHYNRGNAHYKLQDYTQAIEEYGRAIELNPKYATAYNNRGLAYARLHDYARAVDEYERAIELDPELAPAYYNQACAYALMEQAEDAYQWLEKAIGLDERYREMARGDADLNGMRGDERFKALRPSEPAEPVAYKAWGGEP